MSTLVSTASDWLQKEMDFLNFLKESAEDRLKDVSPLKIVVVTAGVTYTLAVLHNIYSDNEYTVSDRVKKGFFSLVRRIPLVQREMEKERVKVKKTLEDDMNKHTTDMVVYSQLPKNGRSVEEVTKLAKTYLDLGDCDWLSGSLSGCVYNADKEVTKLVTEVYSMSAWSNPLHPDVFPGLRKMEAEVVHMGIRMFNGGPQACGTMTSGGSESLLLACKAYRDYARDFKGIRQPEILIAATAHAAFDKASQLHRMRLVKVPVDPVTYKADVKAMRKAISRNTCMIVASAPGFPHGVIDPVREIAALGLEYDIPVHVDACLGGFVIAFMEEAGYPLDHFDFRVEGVTSISADTHKYGYAPKGTSIILYSEPKYRKSQFFVATEWPGGLYASPTLAGSRPGGLIAACWATMMYYGRTGYVEATKKIVQTQKFIENGLRKIDGLRVMGNPDACAVAMDSPVFSIYRVSDAMGKKGWHLSPLQFPSGIHICITYLHTHDGVAQRFLDDMREVVAEIMKDPKADVGGSASVYGTSQSIPDRSMVGEITQVFLETLYSLQEPTKAITNGHSK